MSQTVRIDSPVDTLVKDALVKIPDDNRNIESSTAEVFKKTLSQVRSPQLSGKKQSPIYRELTRRAYNTKKKSGVDLDAKLAGIPCKTRQAGVKNLMEAIKKPNWWDGKVFSNSDYPYYALQAVKDGVLSAEHFANIMCYWSAQFELLEGQEIATVSIADPKNQKEPNPEIVQMIMKQVKETKESIELKQVEDLLSEIIARNNPVDMTLFFTPDNIDVRVAKLNAKESFSSSLYGKSSISTALKDVGYFNLLMERETISPTRMAPSITLYNALLKTLCGEKYTRPNPVLGMSSIKDIQKNGRNHGRDTCIPFPGFCNDEADGCRTLRGYDFTYHDLYHCYISSKVGAHTPAMIKAARVFRTIAKRNWSNDIDKKKLCWGMAWEIEDMEHSLYRGAEFHEARGELIKGLYGIFYKEFTDSDLFWVTISTSINFKVLKMIEATKALKIGDAESLDEEAEYEKIIRKFAKTGVMQALIEDVKKEDSWRDKYNIRLESLISLGSMRISYIEKMVRSQPLFYQGDGIQKKIEESLAADPLALMAKYAMSART